MGEPDLAAADSWPLVLFAEDDPADAELMVEAVRRCGGGLRLRHVSDGLAVLAALQEEPAPAMVVLDVAMPGMDGLAVLRRIRESDRLKDLLVVMLSGSEDPAVIQAVRDLGAAFARKPVAFDELVEFARMLRFRLATWPD